MAALTVAPEPAMAQTTFTPDHTITVGGLDHNRDGNHDYAGATIVVTFNSNSPMCPDMQGTYVLQNNGRFTPSETISLRAHEFGGTSGPNCIYTVESPFSAHSSRLIETTGDSTIDHDDPSSTSAYETASTSFTIYVDMTLIEATSSASFRPRYSPSSDAPDRCDPGSSIFSGWANVATQPEEYLTGRFQNTVALPRGHDENTPECTYDVMWPPDEEGSGTQMTRDLTAPATAQVSPSNPRAHATYTRGSTTTLEPSLTFNVPMVDVDGNDVHDFSGTRFAVMFARSSDTNCSADRTINYYLNDDGDAIARLSPWHRPLRLVNQNKDSPAPCEYSVTFPPGSSDTFVDRLEKLTVDASDDDDFTDALNDAEASYQATEQSFDATLSLTTTNVADDTIFAVTVTPQSETGCTPADTHTLTVASDAASTTVSLIDWPAGYTTAADRCAYDLEWTSEVVSAGVLYVLDADVTRSTTVDGANAAPSAGYKRAGTTFVPTPTFAVPPIDLDGDTNHDFAGTEFAVTFTQPADVNCSDTDTYIYRLDAAGAVSPVEAFALVDQHEDSTDACTYAVVFAPANTAAAASKLAKFADPTTDDDDVSGTANDAAATYRTTEVPFDATLSVTAARVPDDTTFSVNVAPQDAARCTAADAHTLTVATGAASVTVTLIDLPAGYTTLADRCVYDVTWPDDEHGTGTDYSRDPNVAATTTLDGANAARSAAFLSAMTSFTPTLTISVPDYDRDGVAGTNYFEGAEFVVSFTVKTGAGPASGCSPATQVRYVVGDANTAVARSFTPAGGVETTITPTSPLTLTDLPAGEATGCVYVAQFPDDVGSATGVTPVWTLTRLDSQAATADVSAGSPTAARQYIASESSFAPTISLTVPPVLGLPDGEQAGRGSASQQAQNLFAGTTLTVTLRQAAGAHESCSASTPVSVAYTVEPGGAVSPPPSGGLPASLIDRPAGQIARCEYQLGFTPTASSTPAAALEWTLTLASTSAPLTATLPNLTAAYVVGNVTFTPAVAIGVPTYDGDDDPSTADVDESTFNAFSGRTFDVTFARSSGPPSGCSTGAVPGSPVGETYEVDAGGTVSPQGGSEPTLVHLPSGETSDVCVYDVTFPPTVGAAPPLGREATGLDAQTQAADPAAAATYLATEATTFSPAVTVSLPFIDEEEGGANDLASLGDAAVTIAVEYRRATSVGTFAGCTETATETYTVAPEARAGGDGAADGPDVDVPSDDGPSDTASEGTVSGPDTPAVLTDRPARADDRCVYSVLVSETEALRDELAEREVEPLTFDARSAAIAITYEASEAMSPVTPPAVTPPVTPPATQPVTPTVPPPATPPATQPATPPAVTRPTGGSPRTGGGSGGSSSRPSGSGSSTSRDDPPTEWVPSAARRAPVSVSLSQPERPFTPSDAFELLISAPDVCGTDVIAFGGLPSSVGVVFALAASSSATASLVADGAFTWPEVAERDTQHRPCTLRVTLLAAPAGCTLADATSAADAAGRSYVELTWSEGTTSFTLAPAVSCE